MALNLLHATVVVFLASIAATIIGVGWSINRQAIAENTETIEHLQGQLNEIVTWPSGADSVEADEGEIAGVIDRIDEIDERMEEQPTDLFSEVKDSQRLLQELIYRLDMMDSVEEFDVSDVFGRGDV